MAIDRSVMRFGSGGGRRRRSGRVRRIRSALGRGVNQMVAMVLMRQAEKGKRESEEAGSK